MRHPLLTFSDPTMFKACSQQSSHSFSMSQLSTPSHENLERPLFETFGFKQLDYQQKACECTCVCMARSIPGLFKGEKEKKGIRWLCPGQSVSGTLHWTAQTSVGLKPAASHTDTADIAVCWSRQQGTFCQCGLHNPSLSAGTWWNWVMLRSLSQPEGAFVHVTVIPASFIP